MAGAKAGRSIIRRKFTLSSTIMVSLMNYSGQNAEEPARNRDLDSIEAGNDGKTPHYLTVYLESQDRRLRLFIVNNIP